MGSIGPLEHRVTLQASTEVPEPGGGGGSVLTTVILANRVAASVRPATARDLERLVASTVQSTASHLVTLRYLPGVNTKTALIFHDKEGDRPMAISGTHDPEERHVALILECTEVVQ